MAEKKNPVQVLIENRESIINAYGGGKGPKGAWGVLEKDVPEISETMTFNTFKQYVTPFVLIAGEYDRKVEAVTQEYHDLNERESMLKARLETVTQKLYNTEKRLRELAEKTESVPSVPGAEKNVAQERLHRGKPNNIQGWTVHQGKDGYFRMHRRVAGKLYSIYLGNALDRDKAVEKIRTKEKTLGIDKAANGHVG